MREKAVAHTFHVWKDLAVHLGPVFASDLHRHYATQICLGLDSPVSLRSREGEGWGHYRAALVPSGIRHQTRSELARVAMIYLDPTSPQAQGFDPGTPGHGGVITLPDEKAADVARRLQRAGDDPAAIRDAVGGLLPQARLSALRRTDGRIGRAIGILERNLDRNLSLADVSSRLELSPGRFRHLFKKETGTTFSAFRLWTRVLAATRLLARNPDLTWASHEAAFSDSAHFSRSFHQTFGLRPSEIFKSGRFRLVFCD